MAKKSAVERNDKRKRMAKKYAAKRAALMAVAKDQSLSNEERFKARLQLAKLPRNSAPTRVRNRCGVTAGGWMCCKLKVISVAIRNRKPIMAPANWKLS